MNYSIQSILPFGTLLGVLLLFSCQDGICQYGNNQNQTEITFVKSDQTLGNTRSFGLAVGDVDQDSDMDVFIANYIGPSQLWLNDRNGTFTTLGPLFGSAIVFSIGSDDLDKDDDIDVVFGQLEGTGGNSVYFNESIVGIKDKPQPDLLYPQQISNYPNPFHHMTIICYRISDESSVLMQILDGNGKVVTTLVNETQTRGLHEINWDGLDGNGKEMPAGSYLCKLNLREKLLTLRIIKIK